jgi:hypothetical protein
LCTMDQGFGYRPKGRSAFRRGITTSFLEDASKLTRITTSPAVEAKEEIESKVVLDGGDRGNVHQISNFYHTHVVEDIGVVKLRR